MPSEIHPKKNSPKKGPQTPKFPLLLGVWGFGGLFLGEGPRNLSQILGAPKHPPNTHKSKNMASMRSSLLSLLLEHSFEEEETATMLIMLLHPGEATTQICFFLLLLIKYNNSLRFRSHLKRPALLSPRLSPWSRLLASGEESSFLNVTGLTYSAFRTLVGALYDSPEVGLKRGRPASLDENGEVGIYLVFLGSMGSMKHLCLVFGVVPAVASVVIKKMRSLVVSRLRMNPHARVKFPDQAERREFARIIQARERLVKDCIGFVDGSFILICLLYTPLFF